MKAEVFLDAGYAITLAAASDALHERALAIADQLQKDSRRLVTTQAVLLEIGNALCRQRFRVAAVKLLQSLEADPNVEIIPLSTELWSSAVRLYQERLDQEWGLTDCLSFVVMQSRGIIDALTADAHFSQAGFTALLREHGRSPP